MALGPPLSAPDIPLGPTTHVTSLASQDSPRARSTRGETLLSELSLFQPVAAPFRIPPIAAHAARAETIWTRCFAHRANSRRVGSHIRPPTGAARDPIRANGSMPNILRLRDALLSRGQICKRPSLVTFSYQFRIASVHFFEIRGSTQCGKLTTALPSPALNRRNCRILELRPRTCLYATDCETHSMTPLGWRKSALGRLCKGKCAVAVLCAASSTLGCASPTLPLPPPSIPEVAPGPDADHVTLISACGGVESGATVVVVNQNSSSLAARGPQPPLPMGGGAWTAVIFAHSGDWLEVWQESGTSTGTSVEFEVGAP